MLEPPSCVNRDGRILKTHLRGEMNSEDGRMWELRRQYVADPGEVHKAHPEANGEISVVRKKGEDARRPHTTPTEECDNNGGRSKTDGLGDRMGLAPSCNGRPHTAHWNGGRKKGETPAGETSHTDASGEPELAAFLLAAETLQARLVWH